MYTIIIQKIARKSILIEDAIWHRNVNEGETSEIPACAGVIFSAYAESEIKFAHSASFHILAKECGFDLHFLSLWAKENKGVDPVEPGSSDSPPDCRI